MTTASFNLPKLPGKHANTTFLLQDNKGYSFVIEKVDLDTFEFTICIYDDDKQMNRHEYVLHCNSKTLRDVSVCINELLEFVSKSK